MIAHRQVYSCPCLHSDQQVSEHFMSSVLRVPDSAEPSHHRANTGTPTHIAFGGHASVSWRSMVFLGDVCESIVRPMYLGHIRSLQVGISIMGVSDRAVAYPLLSCSLLGAFSNPRIPLYNH